MREMVGIDPMTMAVLDEEQALWPRHASVGEVVYPPGGTLGPRAQQHVQLVFVHSGHMAI
ncbi:MAG: hypothetical protein GYB67_09710, partial [Chloroflexi bacterium]|nr:hypothetical protein [Chloroflexota bacterium]